MEIKITDTETTITLPHGEDITWPIIMDTILHELQSPNIGYVIDRAKLVDWAETTSVPLFQRFKDQQ